MLEHRERELYALTDEVLDWIESYRIPAAARLGVPATGAHGRQPPTPAAFLARDDKRARVLGSVVHLTLDEGYSHLTDPQIAQFAGVSTEAFHKQFPSKEECFLAVLDEFVREALDSVRGSFDDAASWPEGVYRAMAAFVEYLVAHEALLRIAFIDLFEVGPGMIGRMTRSVEGFTKLLTDTRPRAAPRARRGARSGHRRAVVDHLRLRRRRAPRAAAVPGRSPHVHRARALRRAEGRRRIDPSRAQTAPLRLRRLCDRAQR